MVWVVVWYEAEADVRRYDKNSYIRKRAEKKVYCRVVLGRVVKVKVKVKRAKIGVF